MPDPVKLPGRRRLARELAVQFLYQWDLNHLPVEEALPLFWQAQQETPVEVREFAEVLIRGTAAKREEVDQKICAYAEHWGLDRIAAVDRNILRLAIHEMLHRPDIPPVVSINEAVEIAKKFSTRESGAFVNGILDRVKLELTRPARTAAPPAGETTS